MRSVERAFLGIATLAGALLCLPACADHVSTALQPCPCASGYVCCASGVCAANKDSCDAATAALSVEASGEWTGYLENYTTVLPSGSDAVHITLATDAAGVLSGHVVIGQGTPPAPPTDGTKAWPPALVGFNLAIPMEGFAYTVRDLRWESQRLKFKLSFEEPWAPWCHLQTSYEALPGVFACVKGLNYSQSGGADAPCILDDGTMTQIDCEAATLCNPPGLVCACTAAGCGEGSGTGAEFDVALRGDIGDGSMDGNNVRLTRASH